MAALTDDYGSSGAMNGVLNLGTGQDWATMSAGSSDRLGSWWLAQEKPVDSVQYATTLQSSRFMVGEEQVEHVMAEHSTSDEDTQFFLDRLHG